MDFRIAEQIRSAKNQSKKQSRFVGISGVLLDAFRVLCDSLGAFGGPLGSLSGSFGDPWGFLGRSWATRGRFPGFSGKFREAFWLHFTMIVVFFFTIFLDFVF